MSRRRIAVTLRHRRARGASVAELALRFGLTRGEVVRLLGEVRR